MLDQRGQLLRVAAARLAASHLPIQVRMRRIGLAVVLAVSVALAPLGTVVAQPPEKLPRVGYTSPGSSSDFRLRRFESFRQGLRDLGYVEGQNIALEPRWAEGEYDRYPALAADLVRLKAHVIVTVGGAATKAALQTTKTTPIVMSVVIDPLGSRLSDHCPVGVAAIFSRNESTAATSS